MNVVPVPEKEKGESIHCGTREREREREKERERERPFSDPVMVAGCREWRTNTLELALFVKEIARNCNPRTTCLDNGCFGGTEL
jgi:hypothetical protein